ncbi:terminase small subunit [Amycolatopsis magusensis]|uniref:terminase small subunit n=1 Tax=Amycolatopsis magusensis TaxID=882444 RepID=UPI003C2B5CD7
MSDELSMDLAPTVFSAEFATLAAAVRASVAALDLKAEDQGAAVLAGNLAERLDGEGSARPAAELAGKLLAVLESLGATPQARKALLKGEPVGKAEAVKSALDELRERRQRRASGS